MNKTQLFAKSEKELCSYLPAYKTILSATAWVNPKTGEAKRFSAEQKLVWHYVLDRYKFFKDSNKDYFDNQADIAIACDVSERTVIRLFKDLSIAGYLEIHQIRVGGHKSNSYKITKDLVLVQRENTPFKASVSSQVERSPSTDTNAQTAEYMEPELADEAWVHEVIPDYDYEYYELSIDEQDMDSNYYNPEDLKEKTEDDVDELSFMKVKASVQETVKTGAAFTPLPEKLFDRLGKETSDQLDNWIDRNGFYLRGVSKFVANLFHNSTNTNYLIKNYQLVNMGVEQEKEQPIPF
ncbi:helix-turn-helix domain-containing protein [Pseudomonas oryzihabitans]|uniref:helix-turn-helix domain-containing protein n=1 Tax=Pseudomonas oryzihabitans TaxID=47885 RepID=UPI0021D8C5BA|nr:helix-turn-helix domain-containing protein [Pseudomonas oryzihabitans]